MILQKLLDRFYCTRQSLATATAFLSIRFVGIEVNWQDVKLRRYSGRDHKDLNLDAAKSPDDVLLIAQDCLSQAENRRVAVADKCKTLLTVSSLLVALVGILLPRTIPLDATWMKIGFFLAVGALMNAIVLLLVIFDVGVNTVISLDQAEVELSSQDLKKSLINRNLECATALEGRSDFQVDVYKTARCFFLSGFTIVAVLFSVSFWTQTPDSHGKLIRALRSDDKLINLLRGPKGNTGDPGKDADVNDFVHKLRSDPTLVKLLRGMKGEKGDRGAEATIDESQIVDRVLNDPRLQRALSPATTPPP